jgi:ATP-grasp domain
MQKILIVSTKIDTRNRIKEFVAEGLIPNAQYYYFVEDFGNSSAPLTHSDDMYVVDDLRNTAALEVGIDRASEWAPFDAVIATHEYTVLLAARLREVFSVPGPDVASMLKFRDKVLMKRSLSSERVLSPGLFDRQQLRDMPSLFPVVVKPRTYASSVGVSIVQSYEELEQRFPQAVTDYSRPFSAELEFSRDDLEFEELIDGTVHHIDGFVFGGEIKACLPSLYTMNCMGYAGGQPLAAQSISDPEERVSWRHFLDAVHDSLKIPDGAFHLEAFQSKAGKVFLEIGIRAPGGEIVPSIKRATGIDLEAAHIQCQLGIPPSVPDQIPKGYARIAFPKVYEATPQKKVTRVHMPSLGGFVEPNWSYVPAPGTPATANFSSTLSTVGSFTFESDNSVLLSATLFMMAANYRVDMA